MEPEVLLGVDKSGKDVSVKLSVFALHTWIQGQSGSMKSVQVAALARRLLEADPKACFVFGDCGGDLFTFWRVREMAEKLKKPFHFISLGAHDDWSSLDVMAAITPLTNIPRATSYFTSSLSLDAVGFGRSYFSLHNWNDFATAMSDLVAEGNLVPTFSELIRKLHDRGRKRRTSDMTEAQLAADALLHYPQLLPSEVPGRQIDIADAIEKGGVIYGFFPTLLEPAARSLTAMLHWSVVLEQMRRYEEGLTPCTVYDFMDEFASISGAKAIADLVTLARKYGIRLCLINQTSDQLKTQDRDLRRIVFTNTAVKIFLTPYAGDDLTFMQDLSPDVIKDRGKSQIMKGLASTSTTSQQLAPDLERNEALEIAFSRFEGLVSINDFAGYKPPMRVTFNPEITKEEHARLSNRPLPKRDGFTPHAKGSIRATLANTPEREKEQSDALEKLLSQLIKEEEWQTGKA